MSLLYNDPVADRMHHLNLYDPNAYCHPALVPRRQHDTVLHCPAYYRPWWSVAQENEAGSTVICTKDKFQADLDVKLFQPSEITVKQTDDHVITVEGKHDERLDEHGFIARHFVRRYIIPKKYDISKVETQMSTDGVLTLVAPKVTAPPERPISVKQTGKPAKPAIQEKKQ